MIKNLELKIPIICPHTDDGLFAGCGKMIMNGEILLRPCLAVDLIKSYSFNISVEKTIGGRS